MSRRRDRLGYFKMLIVGIPPHEVLVDGVPLDHKGSCKVYNHSPTGFSWGYGGSGPSQLALAILLLFLSPERALKLYHAFKWQKIAGLGGAKGWSMTGYEVLEWIEKHQVEATGFSNV